MKKKFDLVVGVGSYVNKDGEDKTTWENVGVVMENDDGKPFMLLKRTFNPAGVLNPQSKESVLISMFTPNDKDEKKHVAKKEEGWA